MIKQIKLKFYALLSSWLVWTVFHPHVLWAKARLGTARLQVLCAESSVVTCSDSGSCLLPVGWLKTKPTSPFAPTTGPGATLARSRTPSRWLHGDGGSWWSCWPDTFWFGRWSLSLQTPPKPLSPSLPSLTCVACRASSNRVRPNAACRPRRGGQQTVVSESHPSGKSGDSAHVTGRSGLGARCPTAAGAAPLQVCAAGPSLPVLASPKGWLVGSKFLHRAHHQFRPEKSDISRFSWANCFLNIVFLNWSIKMKDRFAVVTYITC